MIGVGGVVGALGAFRLVAGIHVPHHLLDEKRPLPTWRRPNESLIAMADTITDSTPRTRLVEGMHMLSVVMLVGGRCRLSPTGVDPSRRSSWVRA